jgi:hypothetical protein
VSIGGQSVDAGRAALLNQIYGTTCPTGQVLTAQGGSATCVYSVPPGAIAAFADVCPPGWQPFTAANGRFLVGTGDNSLTYSDGTTHNYTLGETGNNAAVKLVLSNLGLQWNTYFGGLTGSGAINKLDPGPATKVDARPPYYAVNWCQKQS